MQKIIISALVLAFSLSAYAASTAVDQKVAVKPTLGKRTTKLEQNQRVIETISAETNQVGAVKYITNSFTEIAHGLNYRNAQGEWFETEAKFEVAHDGKGVAAKGAHRLSVAPNINSRGAVELNTPDNKTLKSHVLGLAYTDFKTGKTVMIAEVKDSIGTILGDNVVLYEDAFDGIQAEIQYTYTADGMEQDIILRERPPLPEDYGFDPKTTWLEVWTEFIDAPIPVKEERIRKGWTKSKVDKTISFGAMVIGEGAAFGLGDKGDKHQGIPVQKHWETVDGRTFLIEEVDFRWLTPQLRALPEAKVKDPNGNAAPRKVSDLRIFPERREAKVKSNDRLEVASLRTESPGFVIDYVLLTTTTNFTFKGNTTYFVRGNFNLSGTTIIEGGAVIKYTNGASINILGTVECQTESYRPAILTSYKDNTVGETISSGTPSGTYADVALSLANGGNLRNLHIRYANKGIFSGQNYTNSHGQFVYCNYAMQTESATFTANNILMYNVGTGFYGRFYHGTATHLTFNQGINITADWDFYAGVTCSSPPSSQISLVNSLVTGVAGNGIVPIHADHSIVLSSATGIYQTVGGASHYLAETSFYRNSGTTGINANLLAAIRKMTTYPPVVYSNATISVTTTLGPQAQRDSDTPDIGYHYDPLDYAFGGSHVNQNVTFSPGTAVGWFRTTSGYNHAGHGIHIADSKILKFDGTAKDPNYFARCNTVQEQSSTNWSGGVGPGGITGWATSAGSAPEMRMTFTKNSMMASEPSCFFREDYGSGGSAYITVNASHSEFSSGIIGGYIVTASLTNCLLQRVMIGMTGGWPNGYLKLRSCTMKGGSIETSRAYAANVLIRDCAFDGTTFSVSDAYASNPIYTDYDYNAFLQGAQRTYPIGVHDVMVTNSYNWQAGPLGNFYLPSTNILINAGSLTNAGLAGLYHFTTATNQVKEANSVVDIGYHYVAVGNDGLPFDADGDGMPDYLEDMNGNGQWDVDDGETQWMPFSVSLLLPTNNAAFTSPATISFQAVPIGGEYPVSTVEYYRDNYPLAATPNNPYHYFWPLASAGSYSIVAIARDSNGGSCTSAAVNITITNLCTNP